MKSLTNLEQKDEIASATPVIYTAYGWVAGVFQPQKKKKKKKLQGILLTEDGQEIPAILDWYVLHRLKKQIGDRSKVAEFLQSVHQWQVYPRTQPLRFDIMKIRMQPCEEQKAAKKNRQDSQPRELDKFRVVGQIRYIADGKVVMRIERNEKVPNRSNNNHPIHLKLSGSIPTGEIGQIWELQVWRCGTKLRISQAKVYQPSENEIKLFNLLNSQKIDSQTSLVDVPAKEADQKLKQVSATIDKQNSSTQEQNVQLEETKPKECQESVLVDTAQAPRQSASTASKREGNGRSKNQSAPPITGIGARLPQQSRFTVQVNGQVFIGQNSVTLTRRVLSVDGKPVAQSKLAVVVGQPKTMQADGSVTKGSDRSVLISR